MKKFLGLCILSPIAILFGLIGGLFTALAEYLDKNIEELLF